MAAINLSFLLNFHCFYSESLSLTWANQLGVPYSQLENGGLQANPSVPMSVLPLHVMFCSVFLFATVENSTKLDAHTVFRAGK